jgi:hypothetical protein
VISKLKSEESQFVAPAPGRYETQEGSEGRKPLLILLKESGRQSSSKPFFHQVFSRAGEDNLVNSVYASNHSSHPGHHRYSQSAV